MIKEIGLSVKGFFIIFINFVHILSK